jgi:hypothetical protein
MCSASTRSCGHPQSDSSFPPALERAIVSAAISLRDRVGSYLPTGRIVLARGRQPRPAARAILKEGPNQHNRNRQCDHDRVLTAAEAP